MRIFRRCQPWLAAALLCLFILTLHAQTARAIEVDLDPTAVLSRQYLEDGSSTMVFLTDVPVVNGSRYLICMTTSRDWPNLLCMRPDSVEELSYGASFWTGEWETSLAITGAKSL